MLFISMLQWSLVVPLLFIGGSKLIGVGAATRTVTRHGYPAWFARVVGALEVIGAIGVAVGFWQPVLRTAGSVLIAAVMLGAIHAHLVRSGEPLARTIPAAMLLTLACAALIWDGLG